VFVGAPTRTRTPTHTRNFKVRHSISSEQILAFYLKSEAKTLCLETVATREEIQTMNKGQERKYRQRVDFCIQTWSVAGPFIVLVGGSASSRSRAAEFFILGD